MNSYRGFRNYAEAEHEATVTAGDTGQATTVVENFAPEQLYPFIVMPEPDADRYCEEHDAEVQYLAKHPEQE